jgi:hypothetical protein
VLLARVMNSTRVTHEFYTISASCPESLCFPRVFHDKMHGAGDFVFFLTFLCVYGKTRKKQIPPCLIQRNEKKNEVPAAHTFPMPFFGASTKMRLSGQEADFGTIFLFKAHYAAPQTTKWIAVLSIICKLEPKRKRVRKISDAPC